MNISIKMITSSIQVVGDNKTKINENLGALHFKLSVKYCIKYESCHALFRKVGGKMCDGTM